ncbi:hypothetical protein EDC04DRAFT_2686951 [Pisolithus marmoratus]|nr:hypothetical protein EDC04DRAFT_2686951 [Pisolithus marmoratus]
MLHRFIITFAIIGRCSCSIIPGTFLQPHKNLLRKVDFCRPPFRIRFVCVPMYFRGHVGYPTASMIVPLYLLHQISGPVYKPGAFGLSRVLICLTRISRKRIHFNHIGEQFSHLEGNPLILAVKISDRVNGTSRTTGTRSPRVTGFEYVSTPAHDPCHS